MKKKPRNGCSNEQILRSNLLDALDGVFDGILLCADLESLLFATAHATSDDNFKQTLELLVSQIRAIIRRFPGEPERRQGVLKITDTLRKTISRELAKHTG